MQSVHRKYLEMETVDWAIVITAIVAVYGAILSTYNLIIKRRENTRQVNVTLTWGLLSNMPEPITMFFLKAANPGKRTVTLTECHIELPDKSQLVMPYSQGTINFPHDLEEGRDCTVWFSVGEVVQVLLSKGYTGNLSIRAVYRDALGREYKSKPFKGKVSEWSKAK